MERNFGDISKKNILTAIGLMSGTSLDGVDVALIQTDGTSTLKREAAQTYPYPDALRDAIRAILGEDPTIPEVLEVERQLTHFHAEAITSFLASFKATPLKETPHKIDIIGFHGHTLWHRPLPKTVSKIDAQNLNSPDLNTKGTTCQIGHGALLAQLTGIPVINQFRQADMDAGGQGAPLVPLYHHLLCQNLPKPVACINIGGIANVTWIGPNSPFSEEESILAFDCGPGVSLLDLWMQTKLDLPFDPDGRYSSQGTPHLSETLCSPWHFDKAPPKSFDRQDTLLKSIDTLSVADGAATLTALTQEGILRAFAFFSEPPKSVILMGGGRHNKALVAGLKCSLESSSGEGAFVTIAEELGWNGDAIEAEAFGFLAVRVLKNLPTSLPSTTGTSRPTCGGLFHPAS